MEPRVDRAHLAAPLALDQGESSWLCAELVGTSKRGPRCFAVLAWLHRTGPRLMRFDKGPGLLDKNQLPAALRDLVPSWLPIITPVRITSDDRPLLMVVLYDLDHPDVAPLQIEREIEHADFDAATFSGATPELAHRVLADRVVIEAHVSVFQLRLEAIPRKLATQFGSDSPMIRHGDIEVGYYQRSRLTIQGSIAVGDELVEVTGAGAHDRHWRHHSVQDLAWLWLHLRLDRDREINAYVIRTARSPGRELGRGSWWIDSRGQAHALDEVELATRDGAYVFAAPSLNLHVRFAHAVARPYLKMRAFGDALDGGIAEAPIRVIDGDGSNTVEGWLEVFDASTCTVT